MKLKIIFTKFDRALAMQVLEMDSRFKGTHEITKVFNAKNGVVITSSSYPLLELDVIHLRGYNRENDYRISVSPRFQNNLERDQTLAKFKIALKEWASTWEGFLGSEDPATGEVLEF